MARLCPISPQFVISSYVKGFCHLKKDIRIFAIHRINSTEITDYTFETDKKIISDTQKMNNPFKFEEVSNIKVWCSKLIAGYVIEQREESDQEVTENKDGSVIVDIPSAPKLDIIKWVLSEGGEAKILEPEWLWEEVVKRAKKIVGG